MYGYAIFKWFHFIKKDGKRSFAIKIMLFITIKKRSVRKISGGTKYQ